MANKRLVFFKGFIDGLFWFSCILGFYCMFELWPFSKQTLMIVGFGCIFVMLLCFIIYWCILPSMDK